VGKNPGGNSSRESRRLVGEYTVAIHIGVIHMIVTTGNDVPGRQISEVIGIVRGIVVRSPGIKQGILGGLKQMFGGNIEAFAEVCDQARKDAYKRMVDHAVDRGADAIIGMRYDATEFAEATTEVLAYGTAVKLA
jgi:uncharacterized protein YbjQ (UPF0145 family)